MATAAVHTDVKQINTHELTASSKFKAFKQEFPTVKSIRNGGGVSNHHKISGGLSMDKEVRKQEGVSTNRTVSRDSKIDIHFHSSTVPRTHLYKHENMYSPMTEINQEQGGQLKPEL
jgi:hypothetical protein